MYERSLTFAPSVRVQSKIEYLKKPPEQKTSSGAIEKTNTNSGNTLSGSSERENKKTELEKTSTKRAEYLNNNVISVNDSRSTLERLANSVQSGSIDVVQDW
jgi:flagellar hook-basal body complex protein FliE